MQESKFYGHSVVKPTALAVGYKTAKGVILENKFENLLKLWYN